MNPAHTCSIVGMEQTEAQALLEWLWSHITSPQFVYRHEWREGDLLVYDNRCLLHRATPYDIARYKRVLQRTTVSDSGPTAPQE